MSIHFCPYIFCPYIFGKYQFCCRRILWLLMVTIVTGYMICDTYFKYYSKMSESSIEKALISEEWEFFVTMQIMNAGPGAWCYEYAKCLSSKETPVHNIPSSHRKHIHLLFLPSSFACGHVLIKGQCNKEQYLFWEYIGLVLVLT